MFARFHHIENTADNIHTFWFEPESRLDYVAGQFTELFLPHDNPDTRGQKHWFTISSSPADSLFSITTKFARGRSSTFKQTLRQLTPGSRLQFAEPMGDFVLPKDKRLPIVFVAGGIGVTPVHSMVKFLADSGEQRDISLLYDVHDHAEMAFTEIFSTYPLRFRPIISRRTDGWTGEAGRVAATHILAEAGRSDDALIYLSGPEPMVETLHAELQKAGVPGRRLVTDYFHGYRDV